MSFAADFTSLRGCKHLIDRKRKYLTIRNLTPDKRAHSSSGVVNRVMYCHMCFFLLQLIRMKNRSHETVSQKEGGFLVLFGT